MPSRLAVLASIALALSLQLQPAAAEADRPGDEARLRSEATAFFAAVLPDLDLGRAPCTLAAEWASHPVPATLLDVNAHAELVPPPHETRPADTYRRLLGRLIEITRPVIDFLNDLDTEKDLEAADKVLSVAVTRAPTVALERIPERAVFGYRSPAKRGPILTRISYQRPPADVERLKSALGASSNREVGEQSFDYSYTNLVEE